MRFLVIAVFGLAAIGKDAAFFEARIRPLLAKHCYACHSQTAMAGLRLDSRSAILHGGKSGPAVLPGQPDQSLLVQAVEHTHGRLRMPPKGKLEAGELQSLREWVASGAEWPEEKGGEKKPLWSLRPIRKPKGGNVDFFITAKLREEGLTQGPLADKRTLIRRVTFDLTGLPPSPAEVRGFLEDASPDAFAKLVDRLLASPHYGERWARHWLDLARYSDGAQGARDDDPYPNAFRYRDWVVQALNDDLPYNEFVRAQIAADQLPGQKHLAALGFQALGESDNDRVDVTTRAFLGFTVGCAQCHDHKFDPIPTKDYYSLLGVFKSSKVGEHPLVDAGVVKRYKDAKAALAAKKEELNLFLDAQTKQTTDILASRTADYLMAAWTGKGGDGLDAETLERWKKYLAVTKKDHPFFRPWFGHEGQAAAGEMQAAIRAVLAEKKALDDRNYVKLGGLEGMKDTGKVIDTLVDSLPIERFYFWRDMASRPYKVEDMNFGGGVYYYGPKDVARFLDPRSQAYLELLRGEVKSLEAAVPPAYPFLHVLSDNEKPANTKVAIRGDTANLGEEAPRRFLRALCDGDPPAFQQGSGRLELANAIASETNPLTARVIANRLWAWHFGEGLVRSASNFGQLGDRPTHPELLDYLAARLIESRWSLKTLHREILLSHTYQLSSDASAGTAFQKDPDNRLYWRANVRERLDAESLRDAILAVSGTLDPTIGGAAQPLQDTLTRRTIYGTVSRSQPNRTMALFDFPDANTSSEQRIVTVGPMQRLFFMNSPFVAAQAKALGVRLQKMGIGAAYELLYGRPATAMEVKLGEEFVRGEDARWPQYAQVLLGAAEFTTVK
ncbi:MAG TPA: PSD1 and planctomycete cytochrome C domain-containing protein [Bryobacteraceae bacterium]|nr:PSD1 and planctomycete cytochrome C domain-containing protein [Bryobacteraceae bacterium]